MAQFDSVGLEGLMMSLEELAALPEAVVREMLTAEGEVLKAAQIRSAQKTFSAKRSRQLEASIVVGEKLLKGKNGPYITVYPQGTRENGVRNAEVGFVEEFGAPKRDIDPTQWMRIANENATEAAVDAAAQVYDKWLKRKGL